MSDKTKCTWTPDQIREQMDKMTQPPICPFCHDALIRCHVEYHDGSGWMHGWQCDCESSEEYHE